MNETLTVSPAGPSCYDSYDFNFQFHSKTTGPKRAICAGKMTVEGDISASGYEGGEAEVVITIFKEVTGRDKEVDSKTITLEGGDNKHFILRCGDVKLGNYYIEFRKKDGGNFNFEGSGTISTS